ncbi:MAG: cob(I)yrinic acid a,c-diamide adenosyltransferase [Clostridia bacterium]|nr:cob(I)yrinic acid a,c-diamide adenosyltransferase [Clostridia bacterium]
MVRIYTRTGDSGETGLWGGRRVGKDDARVEAYGAVDELNAAIGWARTQGPDPDLDAVLARIQGELFAIGADLAAPRGPGEPPPAAVRVVAAAHVAALEADIDRLDGALPPLNRFILPGGTPLAAALHLCRTVCRRAERRAVALARLEAVNPEVVRYLNRLSDLLFVLARAANHRAGQADVTWEG